MAVYGPLRLRPCREVKKLNLLTRLLQCLQRAKNKALRCWLEVLSEGEQTHDSLGSGWHRSAQLSPRLGKRHHGFLIGDGRDERVHHLAERLPLGKRGRDKGRQGPECLCLSVALT
jgi:hypothetical protein